jgi:hypothetical protein
MWDLIIFPRSLCAPAKSNQGRMANQLTNPRSLRAPAKSSQRRMANQLTDVFNPSLLGEGDSKKSSIAAAATAKKPKTDQKMELLKVLTNFDGCGCRGAAKGDGIGLRSELARGCGVAACSPGAALGGDNAGGVGVYIVTVSM